MGAGARATPRPRFSPGERKERGGPGSYYRGYWKKWARSFRLMIRVVIKVFFFEVIIRVGFWWCRVTDARCDSKF